LDELGRATFHLGPVGTGTTMKLVNSLLAFACTWASLEALALAVAGGVDVRRAVEVVRTGGATNFFVDRAGEGIDQRGPAGARAARPPPSPWPWRPRTPPWSARWPPPTGCRGRWPPPWSRCWTTSWGAASATATGATWSWRPSSAAASRCRWRPGGRAEWAGCRSRRGTSRARPTPTGGHAG